ncbi:DMT family transporter [Galbibacter pacificus]|uniref:EamA family transporter n=1 Tax=Galbibacter pacificus TaxID=2996052 RepID=A0ABT6FSN8_9FLAO|nr:EamA family transporter [Galbibacter pacificus]MDG3582594.1 EamA family transporter [Galbibacter pacificus]MDG3586287.1 EamA family transporter [Galbibacter pacificus]
MMNDQKKWIYLIVLSLIWGSSYILIKKGLVGLTPIQLGSVRIIFSTVFLFLIGFRSVLKIKRQEWKWVAVSALCGTFVPVFLFSFAETEIDSSIASILNSLVPLFTIFIGFAVFKVNFSKNQVIGVIIGLLGAVVLIFQGANVNPDQNYFFALLVVVAAICYAINANIVKSKLQEVSPMAIAVGNFAVMVVPAILVLSFSGVFNESTYENKEFQTSLGYIAVLAVFGTGLAKILFNKLIQISNAVFSTSVTYLIPVVGIFWGVLDGEKFTVIHLLASGIILLGVYIVNRNRKKK